MSVTVRTVTPGSPAAELGFVKGDRILSINGFPVKDAIDYLYRTDEVHLEMECISRNGEEWSAEIDLDEGEDVGIILEPDHIAVCSNHCTFCFVDQMPGGLRKSLYIKDDDWRTSFLHGSYVTLTNLSDEDMKRILRWKISPLYVSVHASDDRIRADLLGNHTDKASFDVIRRLAENGISMHTQAVVCEGINDGAVLSKTIEDLAALHPMAISLSIVPVGLTQFRKDLSRLQPVSRSGARAMLDIVHTWQDRCLQTLGTRFVFAADELYVRAGIPFPNAFCYEDFSQIENGVGLAADFLTRAHEVLGRIPVSTEARNTGVIGCITGEAFAPSLQKLTRSASTRSGCRIEVAVTENSFFGSTVTVAGLITARDAIATIKGRDWNCAFLPEIMFRDAGTRTLDGYSLRDITEATGVPCCASSSDGAEFAKQLMDAAAGRKVSSILSGMESTFL